MFILAYCCKFMAFFPSWLVSNCKFVELGNVWSIEYTEQNMGAQAQMQLNRSKNKECNHHNHIKATMLTEQEEEEEEGKKLSNDECFVIEWNIMMVMTKRILCLKRFRTFANEMTKRVVWWHCSASVCVWTEWNAMNTLLMIHSFHATQLTTIKGSAHFFFSCTTICRLVNHLGRFAWRMSSFLKKEWFFAGARKMYFKYMRNSTRVRVKDTKSKKSMKSEFSMSPCR